MSASVAGAIKARLEGLGWHMAVYRDGAPREATGELHRSVSYPFCVVQEGISYSDADHGDQGDPAAHVGVREQIQLDLYQRARALDPATAGQTSNAEDYGRGDAIAAALRGWRPTAALAGGVRIYGVTIDAGHRWPISDNVVRTTWTLSVHRDAHLAPLSP